MISCNQTLGGIQMDCSSSLGGIKKVYIANYDEVTVGVSGESITALTGTFKPYEFRKQTGSMTSTLNIDEAAGVNYVSTELNLVFTKMETAKRLEIAALAKGKLAVIVEDSNGLYWYLGEDDYVSASAGSANTGQNKGDSNNYSITLKDESDSFPKEVSKELVDAVIE
jgi:hypothetical protein